MSSDSASSTEITLAPGAVGLPLWRRIHAGGLRLALDAARAGTWEWFVDSDNHFWSDELWSLYGLSEDDASASTETWWQTIHPDDRARVQAAVNDARDLALPFETEWRVHLPAGAPPRWLLCRGQPVVDMRERVISYIGIVLDVTGQRVAEEKRREGEALLATILDNVGACIYIKDLDYRYLYVNRAMASVFGAPREQICGQRDEAFCTPATVQAWRRDAGRTLFLCDVRTPEEFATGHVEGAINIPYDTIKPNLPALAKIGKDENILLYCRSGRRSAIAMQTMSELGYRKLQNGGGIDSLASRLKVCKSASC